MKPILFEGDYSHEALVRRAIRNAMPRTPGKLPKWSCVGQVFGSGSGMSAELCEAFGFDPHEMVGTDYEDEEEEAA